MSLAGANLSRRDLRNADLTHRVLFGADLRGSRLFGCDITIACDTFNGVMLDDTQVGSLLLLISQADISDEYVVAIQQAVRHVLGDHAYAALMRMLSIA